MKTWVVVVKSESGEERREEADSYETAQLIASDYEGMGYTVAVVYGG